MVLTLHAAGVKVKISIFMSPHYSEPQFAFKTWLLWMLMTSFLLFAYWQVDLSQAFGYDRSHVEGSFALGATPNDFDAGSAQIVLRTVKARGEHRALTAFMLNEGDEPYYSQFGLQAECLTLLNRAGISVDRLKPVCGTMLRLFTCLVLGAFLGWVATCLSKAVAGTAVGYFAMADWPTLASGNLYWLFGLSLLPFVVPWIIFASHGFNRRSIYLVLGIQLVLVFLRSLGGYEYITGLVLAPLPAMTFHWWISPGKKQCSTAVKTIVVVGVVGILGFVSAIGAHLAKGVVGDHLSANEMIQRIKDRAVNRTSFAPDGGAEKQRLALLETSKGYRKMNQLHLGGPVGAMIFMGAYRIRTYLQAHTLTLPGGFGIPLWAFLFVLLATVFWQRRLRRRLAADALLKCDSLVLATAMAALACFSWWICAFNHMMHHPHLNSMTLYHAFMPMAIVLVAYLGRLTWMTCQRVKME